MALDGEIFSEVATKRHCFSSSVVMIWITLLLLALSGTQ